MLIFRFHTIAILILSFAAFPLPARAQPLFHFEHDWTVAVGDQLYGLREVVQTPGGFRHTLVWVGPRAIYLPCRAVDVVRGSSLPAVAVPVGWWHLAPRPNGFTPP
ncbi:MAG: hypothetical protein WDZ59_07415 [Pirellulales bacterium]